MATPKKDPKDLKKVGRKVVWDEVACNELALNMEFWFEDAKIQFYKAVKSDRKTIPFISEFCRHYKIDQGTLLDKAEIFPKLNQALKKAKEIQKEILITGGLNGDFNPTAFIFTAKNITDMRDQTQLATPDGTVVAGFVIVKDATDAKKDIPGSKTNNKTK